jgi:ABC-type transport system substrate-binding protein
MYAPGLGKNHGLLWTIAVLFAMAVAASCAPAQTPAAAPTTAAPASTTAPAATQAPKPSASSGTLTVSMSRVIENLDPPRSLSVGNWSISMTMFDSLVTIGPDGKIQPMLATSWQIVDPTTWKFVLRQGVKFHDGEPFNSAAVKFSLDRIVDPANKMSMAGYWNAYDRTETPDDYTAIVKTKTPVGNLLSSAAVTMMVPPKAAKPLTDFAIGTGPFKFIEWIPDDHLTVEANPDYWQGPPKLQRITFRQIKEQTTRLSALLSGQIDLMDQILPEQIDQAQKTPGVVVQKLPTSFIRQLWLSGGTKPFDDNRVRQAMKYAINTKQIVDSIMQGNAAQVDGCVGKNVIGYVPQTPYSYDPAKAKQLLSDAGYPNGVSVELKFGAQLYPKQQEIADTIAAQLGQVGIKVKVTPQDQALWTSDLLALKWDMEIVGAASPTGDADDPIRRFYISANKRLSWSSPDLDKLLLAEQAESDPGKRLQTFGDICKFLYDQGPVVYLLNDVEIDGTRDRVVGYVPYPDQIMRFYQVSVKP